MAAWSIVRKARWKVPSTVWNLGVEHVACVETYPNTHVHTFTHTGSNTPIVATMAPPAPRGGSARNAAKAVPTPPPTSGPPGAKRARRAVDEEVDKQIDDTPVKKKKKDNGKGKGKAQEVVAADEEPEVENLGEEEGGDADWYDPEGEALGEDEEGYEEGEVEDEEDEGVDLGENTSRARPIEKKARVAR
jgi:hypothetical protein